MKERSSSNTGDPGVVSVAILVATYNGAEYLDELLTSLLRQSYRKTRIYVRDDGSTDGSVAIVERYIGDRVILSRDTLGRMGPAGSFLRLLAVASADVYMFCDQDDIWLPDKVAHAVEALNSVGITQPLLLHTDLRIVDRNLKVLASSFHRHEGIDLPAAHRFAHLVLQNCVVGCSTAVTNDLITVSRLRERIPEYMAMHDWWLALCACCFGQIVYLADADVLYRQHHRNVSGARRRNFWQKVRLQFSAAGIDRIQQYKHKVARQAYTFADYYSDCLPPSTIGDLRAVAMLADGAGLAGVWACFRRGIRLQNSYMNVSFAVSALLSLVLALGRSVRRSVAQA